MTNFPAPNPYDAPLVALKTAAASATDRESIAAAKDDAVHAELRQLACNYSATQIAASLIEDDHHAARLKAAAALGVDPGDVVVESDYAAAPIPPAPDGYRLAVAAMKEAR